MVNSRAKGAGGERQVAHLLEDELGIKFRRDLRQYQQADMGDLIPDVDIGFVIEVKTYASGNLCKDAWWEQASKAAQRAGKEPCVIYKYDRRPWRVAVPMRLFIEDDHDYRVEMDLDAFCYIVRERISDG